MARWRRAAQKRHPTGAILGGLAVLLIGCGHLQHVPAADPATGEAPLVLEGDSVLEIADRHFVHRSGIVLRDRARLVVRGARFEHRQEHSFQHTLSAYDDARVEIVDSQLSSSPWLSWQFHGRSSLVQRNVDGRGSQIWHYFTDETRAEFEGSPFHGTVDGRARVRVAHAPVAQIELVLPERVSLDASFPARAERYSFPPQSEPAIGFRLEVESSPVDLWGLTLLPGSDVTVRDTRGLVVTISATTAWQGETLELSGLGREHYVDRAWDLPRGTRLRLVDTYVAGWSPVAFGDNTLIVRDSVLNDQAFSAGRARILFERVSTSFVRARESVTIVLRDSFVLGDVVAQDHGRIELLRTRVAGRRVAEGQGRVVDVVEP